MSDCSMLDSVEVASPCSASWDEMAGDDRSRHCQLCGKSVYNLSGMTSQEAIDLITQQEGDLCIRLFRRSDGKLINQDCLQGFRRLGRTFWTLPRLAAVACMLLGGLLCPALFGSARQTQSKSVRELVSQVYYDIHEWFYPSPPLMGAMCPIESPTDPVPPVVPIPEEM